MRFSVCLKTHEPFDDLVEVAAHAERTGWDGVWYTDHLLAGAGVRRPEAWMTLAALAARVPRVRLGPLVTGNTFRHPAVLAKMAATLDHISGGRLVLGLGSAWAENEHRQYGIPYYTVPERLRRLDEACTVIKLLFNQAVSDFDGRYYQLDGATLEPKPVQNPLPLLIGGGGEKVTLRITAKHADEWNIYGSVETLKRKMRILDQHCANVRRDPSEIQRSAAVALYMSDDKAFIDEMKRRDARHGSMIGSVDEVREIVEQYAAIGVDELIVPDYNLGSKEQRIATMDAFIKGVVGR